MDHLWTPWRFQYMASAGRVSGCVLCRLQEADQGLDKPNLVLVRNRHTYTVLNRFPYTSGHLMVVTRRHLESLTAAQAEEVQEMILEARRCESILQKVYRPDGFNVGINVGKSAGAGVEGHLHLHIVPRWQGDANFVSVVGETRVIPEELETTFEKLQAAFASGAKR